MPTALRVKRLRNESSERDSYNQSSIEYISRNLQFVVSIENQERFSKSASHRFPSFFSPPAGAHTFHFPFGNDNDKNLRISDLANRNKAINHFAKPSAT